MVTQSERFSFRIESVAERHFVDNVELEEALKAQNVSCFVFYKSNEIRYKKAGESKLSKINSSEKELFGLANRIKKYYFESRLGNISRKAFTNLENASATDVNLIDQKVKEIYADAVKAPDSSFKARVTAKRNIINDAIGITRNAFQIPYAAGSIFPSVSKIALVGVLYFFQMKVLRFFQGFFFVWSGLRRLQSAYELHQKMQEVSPKEKEKLQAQFNRDLIFGFFTLSAGVLWIMLGAMALIPAANMLVPEFLLFSIMFIATSIADIKDGQVQLLRSTKYFKDLDEKLNGVSKEERKKIIIAWVKEKIKPDIQKILDKESVKELSNEKREKEIERLIKKKMENKIKYLKKCIPEDILKIIIENRENDDEKILAQLERCEIDIDATVVKNLEKLKTTDKLLYAAGILSLLGSIVSNLNAWFGAGIISLDFIMDIFWTALWIYYLKLIDLPEPKKYSAIKEPDPKLQQA